MSTHRYFVTEEATQGMIVRITESQLSGDVNAEILKLELTQLVGDATSIILFVDFRAVKMIGSSFISVLITLKKRLTRQSVRLVLCDMPASVRNVFRTLNLEGKIFEIFDSVPSAMRAVNSGQLNRGETN